MVLIYIRLMLVDASLHYFAIKYNLCWEALHYCIVFAPRNGKFKMHAKFSVHYADSFPACQQFKCNQISRISEYAEKGQ